MNSASLVLFPVENLTQSPNIYLQGGKWHIDGCYRTDHGSSQPPVSGIFCKGRYFQGRAKWDHHF